MDQEEDFKQLLSTVKEQARARIKSEIDQQFGNFIKALEAKKDALHHEVDTKYQNLKIAQDAQQQNASTLLTEAKKSLDAGSLVYKQHPKLAFSVWKKAIVSSPDNIATLDVSFPSFPPYLIDTFATVSIDIIPPSEYPMMSLQSMRIKSESGTITTKQDLDQRLKILLVGDSQVGKSCLLQQYVDNTFSLNSLPTIGTDFKLTSINLNGKQVKLQIWDMSGKERFRALAPGFFKGSDGVMITYDITSQESLASVKQWIVDVETYAPTAAKLIVGNKLDLIPRVVELDVAKKLAEQVGIPYLETSATDGKSVREAFTYLVTKVVQALEHQHNPPPAAKSPSKGKEDCIVS